MAEGCADGRAELGAFGNRDAHAIEFFEGHQYLTALRQEREIAYEDNVLDARADAGKDGRRANCLEHHENNAEGHVFRGGVALGFA